MGQAIGGSLPLAAGIALRPDADRRRAHLDQPPAKVNGPAFVLGRLIGLGIAGAIVLALAGAGGASKHADPASWVQIALRSWSSPAAGDGGTIRVSHNFHSAGCRLSQK
ncbi:MAG: hypothetical protein ACRDOD_22550 [Streptosporangiaceae bacterium]